MEVHERVTRMAENPRNIEIVNTSLENAAKFKYLEMAMTN